MLLARYLDSYFALNELLFRTVCSLASSISTADLLDLQHMFAIIAYVMYARLYVGDLLQCVYKECFKFSVNSNIVRCHVIID